MLKKEEEERKAKEVQLYSDNSDSDDDVKVHDFRAADELTGRMVYLRMCDEEHLRPVSNFMDKLSEELVSVVRGRRQPRTAMCAARFRAWYRL